LLGIDEADWAKIEQVSMEIHDAPGQPSEGRVAKIKAMLEGQGFSVVAEQDDALRGTGTFAAVLDDAAPFAPQYDLRCTLRRFEAPFFASRKDDWSTP